MSATQKASVLRQVEYYFSDVSLPYDEFLKKAYDENGAAIPIATIADSPRIIKICDGLDQAARQALVSEVISAESDSVKVVDGKLTRIYPLPDDDDKAMRSVYLGGCARSLTAEALTEGLTNHHNAANYAPIVSVRRLRDLQRDRAYSGQFFVECEQFCSGKR